MTTEIEGQGILVTRTLTIRKLWACHCPTEQKGTCQRIRSFFIQVSLILARPTQFKPPEIENLSIFSYGTFLRVQKENMEFKRCGVFLRISWFTWKFSVGCLPIQAPMQKLEIWFFDLRGGSHYKTNKCVYERGTRDWIARKFNNKTHFRFIIEFLVL